MWRAFSYYVRSLVSAWSSQIVILALGSVVALVGALYFVSAGHAWLAARYGAPVAGLAVGATFLILGLGLIAIAKLRGHTPSMSGQAVVSAAAASTAGRAALKTVDVGRRLLHRPLIASMTAAIPGVALVLLRRALARDRDRPDVELLPPLAATPRRIALDDATVSEAATALTAALGRSGATAAHQAADVWRELAPEIGRTARDVRRLVAPRLNDLGGAVSTLVAAARDRLAQLTPRRRTRRQQFRDLINTLSLDRARVAQATGMMAFAALLIFLARMDDDSV